MHWRVAAVHGGATLTVSQPDGVVYRQEFAAGEQPEFVAPEKGGSLPDGAYTWELVLAPRNLVTRDGSGAQVEEKRAEGRVVSGTFVVRNGAISLPSAIAERPGPSGSSELIATPEDQVIPDDLIVQGSGCFGFDCVNNESFGFDTIRLKENNLRIKFEDTSVGAFPANDWQLTANDSASGGSNKFSIEDITGSKVPFTITAGATTNSIFVDSTGRVGFRTSTPVLDLHAATSNTPALRLEQNNSGGFTAQTWDIGANEANFFVRDVTGGSKLSFRIRPGAPTSSIDIAADGKVGIGTASPDAPLDVESTGTFSFFRLTAAGASPNTAADMTFTDGGADGKFRINIVDADAHEFELDASGNLTVTGSYKVNGTTLNVPDFVFEPEYELLSLDGLKSYVGQHGHLPDVPSAAEIASDGLDMTDMQLRLLRKVEELTLYVLQQHEHAAEQRKKIDELERKLASLESSNR